MFSMLDDHLDPHQVWVDHVLRSSHVAAVALLVWDILITFDDEVRYIWIGGKYSIPTVKYLFLFIRYFAVFVQIAQIIFRRFIQVRFAQPSLALCHAWEIFDLMSAECVLVAVEILLMLRVYALFERDLRMAWFLLLLLVIEITIMTFLVAYTLPNMHFSVFCISTSTPRDVIFFCFALVSTQSLVWIFSVYKYFSALRAGWGRSPMMRLLVQDSAYTFAGLILTVLASGLIYGLVDRSLFSGGAGWLLTLMSCAGCRIIINMHDLAERCGNAPDNDSETKPVQLTTVLGMLGTCEEFQTGTTEHTTDTSSLTLPDAAHLHC
ncbi:hypothetical protein PLICRDRAFT_57875 [Plicaturopsis crispa FD-325 SS-3]|uniref:DUF6533 domain-containing protein n=1 Tax=Plicaturopsis crispa FD-325 SS-3 TaxID=944288 RepID=A0A0C9T3Y4_PLICR|nr:hypothetical protein PLICRDRAFT_57875 [Plicaturopsis crispa FD-325 SS-3]